MDFMERFARVTDLFQEGTEVYVGDDPETDKPLVIWVNKLNSFETEEARADGNVRRSERMAALGKTDSIERMSVETQMGLWDDETLAANYVSFSEQDVFMKALDDLETDPDMRERIERLRRLPEQMAEQGADADDPRHEALAEDQQAYLQAIDKATRLRLRDLTDEALAMGREKLEKAYFVTWVERQTLDYFMAEHRKTQIFFAMRRCEAEDVSTVPGKRVWDHGNCDHSLRALKDRSAVRGLPDQITQRVIDAIDAMRVSPRQAGKSDAPPSSSDSSGQSSTPEAASMPSSPEATPVAPPTS